MSRFLGRVKNKGLIRRNKRALEYIKKIIAKQEDERTKINKDTED